MKMLKIGNTDFSNRVVAEGYSVSSYPVYKTRTDVSGTDHQRLIRNRISGKIRMQFNTMEEYLDFEDALDDVKQTDGSYQILITNNKTNAETTIYAFLDYTPVRRKNGRNEDIIEQFEITVTER